MGHCQAGWAGSRDGGGQFMLRLAQLLKVERLVHVARQHIWTSDGGPRLRFFAWAARGSTHARELGARWRWCALARAQRSCSDLCLSALFLCEPPITCPRPRQHFVEKVCKELWVVGGGTVQKFKGQFADYKKQVPFDPSARA